MFSAGSYAQDQRLRGRVIDYRCLIEFGNGRRLENGDVLFGDVDGVVIIPAARLAEVVQLALPKVAGEEQLGSPVSLRVTARRRGSRPIT